MTWINNLAEFVKRLLQLENRVEKNSQQIEELRQDLKKLTDYVARLGNAVQHDRQERAHDQELNATERENLVLRLRIELMEMEKRIGQYQSSVNSPKLLSTENSQAISSNQDTNRDLS
ncbi:hypothetical protein ACQ4M4_25785 [Leptolyngbya sp. AN02str]|uniref:hypothetical protein n=1 Tax=Leptolyngbya sp. AN02str TaxID=3423363 RepID=UPI003D318E96